MHASCSYLRHAASAAPLQINQPALKSRSTVAGPHGHSCRVPSLLAPPACSFSSCEHANCRRRGGHLRAQDAYGQHQGSPGSGREPRQQLEPQRGLKLSVRRAGTAGLAALQALALSAALQLAQVDSAEAVLSNPNAKMPRSVEAALRRSTPALNPQVAQIQKGLEDVGFLMRIPQRKPWGTMAAKVDAALHLFDARSEIEASTPPAVVQRGHELVDEVYSKLKQLQLAIDTQQPTTTSLRVAAALDAVEQLEVLQAPGLSFSLPKEYANAPRLVGRAVVQLQIDRKGGAETFVKSEGGGKTSSRMVELTLDGYSAPITAGNFLINVQSGMYDGRPVNATYASVLVSGNVQQPWPPIPLEILPIGEFDPVYRLPLDIRGGELPVLPLSIPGAVAMARSDIDGYVSGEEFFIGKFTPQQAGLAGLAFDEGSFGIFGYVTKGLDTVEHLEPGDVLTKATVLSGADKLVRPGTPAAPAVATSAAPAAAP